MTSDDASLLADENAQLKRELETLKQQLALQQNGSSNQHISDPNASSERPIEQPAADAKAFRCDHSLSKAQVERYSRHLLLPSFGLRPQEALCNGSVLIIGCGGLGSPAALYLAAAGVGRLGLVDHDVVDLSNLHRQVIHTEARVGCHKALSAAESCRAINSQIKVVAHTDGLTPANALDIIGQYDVVVDATDNPTTRYLINDACVVCHKPLVSAAAVGTDGQLTVYGHGPDAPCYRCLFPEAPAPENCSRCADAGVLGPVPGVMGVLQAIEAIKVLGGVGEPLARKLLIFDALAGRFTTIKLRGRQESCVACGSTPAITRDNLAAYDYVSFTGQAPTDGPPPPLRIIPAEERITPKQLMKHMQASMQASGPGDGSGAGSGDKDSKAHGAGGVMVLDVRPQTQFALLQHPATVLHVPFEQLEQRVDEIRAVAAQAAQGTGSPQAANGKDRASNGTDSTDNADIGSHKAAGCADGAAAPGVLYVMCRRGNNSQRAVAKLRQLGITNVVDVVGGIEQWARDVAPDAPIV